MVCTYTEIYCQIFMIKKCSNFKNFTTTQHGIIYYFLIYLKANNYLFVATCGYQMFNSD
jgi:hypothetical protein